jgi:hypothetical protein
MQLYAITSSLDRWVFRPTGISNARWSGGRLTISRVNKLGKAQLIAHLNCPSV